MADGEEARERLHAACSSRAHAVPYAAHAILPRLKTYDRVIVAHKNILDAIKARDQSNATEWMRKHTNDFKFGYESIGFDADEHLVDSGFDSREAAKPHS